MQEQRQNVEMKSQIPFNESEHTDDFSREDIENLKKSNRWWNDPWNLHDIQGFSFVAISMVV